MMTLVVLDSASSDEGRQQAKRGFAARQRSARLPLSLDVRFKLNHPAVFLLRLESDCWESEGIYAGDVLVVDRSLPLSANSLVVTVSAGELVLAKVKRKEGAGWQLLNQRGRVIAATYYHQEAAQLWGVVKALVREY